MKRLRLSHAHTRIQISFERDFNVVENIVRDLSTSQLLELRHHVFHIFL